MKLIDNSEKMNTEHKFSYIRLLRDTLNEEDKQFIKSLKCGITYHEFTNNICCANEPTEEEINSIAVILGRVYYVDKYMLWYDKNINAYRLVFGF